MKQQCGEVGYILAIPVESVPLFISSDYRPGEMSMACICGRKDLVTVAEAKFKKYI